MAVWTARGGCTRLGCKIHSQLVVESLGIVGYTGPSFFRAPPPIGWVNWKNAQNHRAGVAFTAYWCIIEWVGVAIATCRTRHKFHVCTFNGQGPVWNALWGERKASYWFSSWFPSAGAVCWGGDVQGGGRSEGGPGLMGQSIGVLAGVLCLSSLRTEFCCWWLGFVVYAQLFISW